MRTLILLPVLACMCSVQAQQIDGYRYWFDDVPASAVTTSVTSTSQLALTANWPTGSMEPGYHRVSIQLRDSNGAWSVPQTQYFIRGNHAITGYRYWVNDDTGSITTGSIAPGMDVTLNNLISPGALPNDFNTVTIQFNDADGEWSVPYSAAFVKNTGEVNSYEYWIDDAIGSSTSGSIGPNGIVHLIDDLPTTTTSGTHFFTIRFSSVNGSWSVPLTTQFDFFTSIPELPGVSNILLFPNPVTDQVTLRLDASVSAAYEVSIWDATGRMISAPAPWSVQGLTQRGWDTSSLSSGSYTVRISSTDHAVNLPFIKQ